MQKISSGLGIAAATLVLALSCTSTQVTSSWINPQVDTLGYERVLVVASLPDEPSRRQAEDAFARRLTGVEAVPSYTLVDSVHGLSANELQALGSKHDFDGVVTMEVVTVVAKPEYAPPSFAVREQGIYQPGELVGVNTDVVVETNLYDLRAGEGALAWSGTTQTRDPRSLKALVGSVASAAAQRLLQEGVLEGAPV